ncbi:2-amino-4-hydroxy-6-hydroxymethyldihydropteridine diphosphokinase [Nocardia vulneris]|uniref:2-amino-4-hydroxy-6-hydroxymethyldihydropteridine diphosphokinase n=1 Tax=Nocardia vulneris TaxID=1141657 RepID=A0ABR4Z4Q1_9NOCA|nr:2-amino-4-hydroxy-6-hydroxymethyldihydropteridine diphosphokinase [Nocardia vulneris]KIA60278.1 2-amino-4-hydroxy-6-hydroxymethyldihydropteridine pyrophosphokinase [Nocardia vulneris]
MSRAVLSIGSNLGDRLAHLRSVVHGFGDQLVAVSPVYSTAPWGGVEQDDYLNAIVVAEDPELGCRDWLRRGQALEQAAARVREVRWGPRTLDVDVIWCAERSGDGLVACSSTDPVLTLPHPQAHRRAFVLIPWLDLDPDATLEVEGGARRVADLLAELPAADRAGVHRTDLALTAEGPVR